MDLTETDTDPCPEARRWTKPVAGQTVLRHELVTARAISRLSHSVAQLSASNSKHNPSSSKCTSRAKSEKQNFSPQPSGSISIPGLCESKPNSTHSIREEANKTLAGSKRKWEADSRRLHVAMDVDQHISKPSPIKESELSANVTISKGSILPRRLGTPVDRILKISGDEIHDSLCSSMLSLSTSASSSSPSSPSNQDHSGPSSDENEADAEGDGDESGSRSRYTSPAHSRTSISPFGMPGSRKSSHATGVTIPQTRRLPRVSRGSICGGDSSDGLSVNMKIPRLTHSPNPLSDACSALASSRRFDMTPSFSGMKHVQRALCSCNRGLHQQHLLRCGKSDPMIVDMLDNSKRRVKGICAHVRYNSTSIASRPWTLCKGAKSTSSSSCSREGSPSCPNQRHGSPESCEDLANDEQSDFPADEFLPPRCCRASVPSVLYSGNYRGTMTRADRSVSHSRRHLLSRHCPVSWKLASLSALPSGSPDPNEIDSEWEEIMQGTWPLLTHRARLNYLKGVTRGKPSTRIDSPDLGLQRIAFVPSKLNEVHMNQTGSNMPVDRKIPTPPWIGAEERYGITAPLSDNPNIQLMDSTSSGHTSRAGLGSRATFESPAAPIPQNNTGHKLLRKLGWKPGNGLGLDRQGVVDPIECTKYNRMNSS